VLGQTDRIKETVRESEMNQNLHFPCVDFRKAQEQVAAQAQRESLLAMIWVDQCGILDLICPDANTEGKGGGSTKSMIQFWQHVLSRLTASTGDRGKLVHARPSQGSQENYASQCRHDARYRCRREREWRHSRNI
jgi:hypothetical protein